ncbi:hypothetical protein [Deinococcus sp.]|uniref:hypothetical protein n=1 Tax=Deinococcus sp. TaxID=47478 RepID=UPI0025CE82D8|nr:hypothetical protein [Deinococcus sp.]
MSRVEINPPLSPAPQTASRTSVQRVHVTLRPEVCASPDMLQGVLDQIEGATGMVGVNSRRLERYGILSGEVRSTQIARLAAIDGVQSVQTDQLKRAL